MRPSLLLQATDYTGPARWRWVLTSADDMFLADHDVRLDTSCWQYEALTDLPGYLRGHVAPDVRVSEEAGMLASLGAWMGEHVLGPVGPAMMARLPVTVRVAIPDAALQLALMPLELAHVDGRPLGLSRVSLVFDRTTATDSPAAMQPAGERLRVLGLFSMPSGTSPLNLARQRYELARGFGAIAAGDQRIIDVRLLQYGVTRARLAEVLEEGEGWDIVHIAGHGAHAELLLEEADGRLDPISVAELADLLTPASDRLKLVTISACVTGALITADLRQLLSLPILAGEGFEPGRNGRGERAAPARLGAGATGKVLANEIANRLNCAVLATRYPVTDEFATALFRGLYVRLLGRGQPLSEVLGLVLHEMAAADPTPAMPALSPFSPRLYGAAAATLALRAPARPGPVSFDTEVLKLAWIPPEPQRFVGRTAVMARASAAVAPRSGVPGVLLHGMPGGGKTACALELAYTHEHAFDVLVWFKAPDAGWDTSDALTRFALTLENQLPGLQLVHLLEDEQKLAGFLPALTAFLERTRILIIIDNIESLLTDAGQWRDPRWGRLIGALTGHQGLGRVILTGRRLPAGLDVRVRVVAVDALSLDESLLLARELPHLSALMDGNLRGIDPATARDLAAGILELAQGHPKLLELADGQAAYPDRLHALVQEAGAAWRAAGGLPAGFFTTGETSAGGADFLQAIGAWTRAAAHGLTPAGLDVFWFLCCLEEGDRIRPVLEDNWADLWHRLGREGDPPALQERLTEVVAAGLATAQTGGQGNVTEYGLLQGVAATGRDLAGVAFREAADTELAAFWTAVADQAISRESEADTGGLVIRAGLSAAPYLLRLHGWQQAQRLLARALARDHSQAVAGAALPALRTIADAMAGTDEEPLALSTLARALERIDPGAGERQMAAALATAVDHQDYRAASVTASDLIDYRRKAGRLREALQLAEDLAGYTRQAGLGPWTQLAAAAQRLQILTAMGQARQVLDEVRRQRGMMETLPRTPAEPEAVIPWDVRETLLYTGYGAAVQLGQWAEALDLNAAVVASMQARGSPETEIARMRFNDYGPLLRLGQLDDAVELLFTCREVFERANDIMMLGRVLSALAGAEDARGHGDRAIGLERDALRYRYAAEDVADIQASHDNLGSYLARYGGQSEEALAHRLAAALLSVFTGAAGADRSVRAAAGDLRAEGEAAMPADVASLCFTVGQTPGVNLDRLLAALADPVAADQALQELTARVRAEAAAEAPPEMARYLASWDPVAAGLAAAAHGDEGAGAAVREHLAGYADSADWAGLARALGRILDGDDAGDLAAGLDVIDTAILDRTADAVAGRISLPAQLWPAMALGPLLGDITAAAGGDTTAAQRARQRLDALAAEPDLAPLADALGQILGGDRDPAPSGTLDDPIMRSVVACVLEHIGAGNTQQGKA